MKVTDRMNLIDNIDSSFWDGKQRKLTIYYHGDKYTVKVKVAHTLRQGDIIDSIDKIVLYKEV